MSGIRRLVGAAVVLLLLFGCGGSFTADEAPLPGATASGGTGGVTPPCAWSGAPADSCAGAGGDDGELEAYARLRAACDLSVKVNRRGAPVTLDPCFR